MRLPRSFALAGLCLVPAFLIAQTSATPTTSTTVPAVRAPEEMVEAMRLRDATLDMIIDRLEVWTGRIVLRPQSLPPATITLNIAKPVPKSEAIQAFVSALALNNIGVVEMGDKYLKIIELANKTRTEAPELITGSTLLLPPSGKTAAKVFELNNLKAQDFVPQLNPMLNVQLGGAVLFNNTNSFLVTDSIANLQRVEQLLLALDRPANTDFTPKFYSLRFAKASDLVGRVKLMLQSPTQQALGNSLSLSADDRTNQVVLIADSHQHPFFDELIAKLDVKADPNTRNEVIYLKHATAKDVSTLLTTVITGQTAAVAKSTGNTRAGQQTGFGNTSPFNPTPATPAPAANAAPRPAPAANAAATALASDSATQFSSLLTVASDDRSNAVVVSGTVDDIRLIRELVDKIDIVLAQVRIEVVIAEVTLSDTDMTGINSLNLTFGKGPNGGTTITNFSGSVAGVTVPSGSTNPLTFVAALQNTGQKNNLKVLSSPTIVTTHNNEAEIIVGESRPIITGSTATPNTGTGGGTTTSSTVTYKDIAIDLKVTPLIGEDGNIQLKIDQQVNDIVDNVTIDGNDQPVIGRRQATSFINVLDGQMIILGGLQRTKLIKNRTKLGFLAEIPGLSQLLGARTNTQERTELLLFIRPHVMATSIGTNQAQTEISRMSNKDEITQHLTDTPFNPPPPPPAPVPPAKPTKGSKSAPAKKADEPVIIDATKRS